MAEYEELGGVLRPQNGAQGAQQLAEMQYVALQNEMLEERLASLELALEDQEWLRVQESSFDFSREGLGTVVELARTMYLKNPLIKRAVNVQAYYIWARGFSVQSSHEPTNELLQEFMDDPLNQAELTEQQSLLLKEVELQTDGNIFFVFFTEPGSGRVQIRSLPFREIQDVVTNPEDAKERRYYKRVWTVKELNHETGRYEKVERKAYYPDINYFPVDAAERPGQIGEHNVEWDTPVYHVRVGGFSDMKFGVSEVYAAIDWARAYKEFLEDVATLMRSYSRFAWKLTTPGGTSAVAAAKTKLRTTYASPGADSNPPPLVGSTFIGGSGNNLTPFSVRGASVNPEDGRRLLLMVAAATGLPETFFGDADVGNLATAKSLDRPTELKFVARQMLWTNVFQRILDYVVLQAVEAPSGPLKGYATIAEEAFNGQVRKKVLWGTETVQKDDGTSETQEINAEIDVTFPQIIEHDQGTMVSSIISAATLDGKSMATTMDRETLSRLLLGAIGVGDVDNVIQAIKPLWEEEDERKAEMADLLKQGGGPEQEDEDRPNAGRNPDPDASTAEALRELRFVLSNVMERYLAE